MDTLVLLLALFQLSVYTGSGSEAAHAVLLEQLDANINERLSAATDLGQRLLFVVVHDLSCAAAVLTLQAKYGKAVIGICVNPGVWQRELYSTESPEQMKVLEEFANELCDNVTNSKMYKVQYILTMMRLVVLYHADFLTLLTQEEGPVCVVLVDANDMVTLATAMACMMRDEITCHVDAHAAAEAFNTAKYVLGGGVVVPSSAALEELKRALLLAFNKMTNWLQLIPPNATARTSMPKISFGDFVGPVTTTLAFLDQALLVYAMRTLDRVHIIELWWQRSKKTKGEVWVNETNRICLSTPTSKAEDECYTLSLSREARGKRRRIESSSDDEDREPAGA